MIHYICTGGCKGVSNKPGVCQAENCRLHGTPLWECGCEDGLHYGKLESYDKEQESYNHETN